MEEKEASMPEGQRRMLNAIRGTNPELADKVQREGRYIEFYVPISPFQQARESARRVAGKVTSGLQKLIGRE